MSVGQSLRCAKCNQYAPDRCTCRVVIVDESVRVGRDLAAMLHGLEVHTRSRDPGPPMPYGETGKQKAQWKRERAGRKS